MRNRDCLMFEQMLIPCVALLKMNASWKNALSDLTEKPPGK